MNILNATKRAAHMKRYCALQNGERTKKQTTRSRILCSFFHQERLESGLASGQVLTNKMRPTQCRVTSAQVLKRSCEFCPLPVTGAKTDHVERVAQLSRLPPPTRFLPYVDGVFEDQPQLSTCLPAAAGENPVDLAGHEAQSSQVKPRCGGK